MVDMIELIILTVIAVVFAYAVVIVVIVLLFSCIRMLGRVFRGVRIVVKRIVGT